MGDYEIFLLRNRLLIYRVESLLESERLDLLRQKHEGSDMIALKSLSFTYFHSPAGDWAARGEAPVPTTGQGGIPSWEELRGQAGLKRAEGQSRAQ